MFVVKSWSNGQILGEYASLDKAKKACRSLGYESYSNIADLLPIAFVGEIDNNGKYLGLVYNPRFTLKD